MLRSVDLNSNHDDYGRDLRGKTGSKLSTMIGFGLEERKESSWGDQPSGFAWN